MMPSDFTMLSSSVSMWDNFFAFWQFNDANLIWVVVGTVVLGMSAAMIGTFAFLKKRSLMGDALAHSALPGVMTAFILFQTKDPIIIFVGAILTSFIGFFLIDWLPKHTKIKTDAAMAITLSFFFALGLMELSYIQTLEGVDRAGIDKIMFGQAAAMTLEDIQLLIGVAVFIFVMLWGFFDKFRLITFHRQYAMSLGIPVAYYELLLALLIVLSVVIGLQIVGVVLMAAVLLVPVAAAKYWSNVLVAILLIAALIGGLSGLFASQISYLAPSMPTGPWMVLSLSFLFAISFLFGRRGMVRKYLRQRKLFHKVIDENILRTVYKIHEKQSVKHISEEMILNERRMSLSDMKQGIQRLIANGKLQLEADSLQWTQAGQAEAIMLTRKHRLWENYLHQHMDLTDKAMHERAEEIEHLLSEEATTRLENEMSILDNMIDPHGKLIPKAIESDQTQNAHKKEVP